MDAVLRKITQLDIAAHINMAAAATETLNPDVGRYPPWGSLAFVIKGFAVRDYAALSIAAIFVAVLILHTDFDSPPSSLLVEASVLIIVFPIPVSVSAVPFAVATTVHSPIATHCAIVAIVTIATCTVIATVVARLRPPVAPYLDVSSAVPVLLLRLIRLLGAALGLNRTSLLRAGSTALVFRKYRNQT